MTPQAHFITQGTRDIIAHGPRDRLSRLHRARVPGTPCTTGALDRMSPMSQPTSIIIIAGALVAVHHAGDTLRRCGHWDTPLSSFNIVIVSSI
jgi:hypothetical protein